MIQLSDTICAPATPVGSGAVSVVRVSGPKAMACADALVHFRRGRARDSKGYEVKYGEIKGLDQVLVCLFRAPHSYTGEDGFEISCHASPYVVSEIISRLCELGCRMAEPGEFTRRAFLNGKMDLAQAEAVADLIVADSAAAHRLALSQLKGRYSDEFKKLRAQLVELASLVELELDFSEEEVEFADRDRLARILGQARARIEALKASYRIGNAVKSGVPVAIAGAPNSGKSTLLNALLCEDRAIVSPIPGTTRDTVEETLVLGGVRYRFIDTAGIRESSDAVERLGIERSLEKLRTASIVIGVVDATASPEKLRESARSLAAELSHDQKLILALNKIDLPGAKELHPEGLSAFLSASFSLQGDGRPRLFIVRISALTGDGLDELREAIEKCGYGVGEGESAIVTSARHYSALCEAAESLSLAQKALEDCLPGDLLAEDLRTAIASLGSIFGEITTDELLGNIFENFCIGK